MKHLYLKYICLGVILFTGYTAKAQAPFLVTLCDHNVSTNAASSANNNLPLWDDPVTPEHTLVPDVRYLNGFDWVNLNTYSTHNIFFTQGQLYGEMTNLKPSDPLPWYNYLYFEEDMTPESGWELLLQNLGYYPDYTTINDHIDLEFSPYVVMYNRYQGLIRVFVNYGRNQLPAGAIDGLKIDLAFLIDNAKPDGIGENNYSGLLRPGNHYDNPLDQKTVVKKMSAVAKNPGLEHLWYSADFQVGFDPCTCTYPSNLQLTFNFFSETDLVLEGRSITGETDLAGAEQLVDQDFLGSFELTKNGGDGDASNGNISYKSVTGMVDEYIARMEKYKTDQEIIGESNDKVKRNLAIAKAFKSVILNGNYASLAVAGVSIIAASNNNEEWADDLSENAEDLIDEDTVKFLDLSDGMKKLLGSAFDYVVDKNFQEKPVGQDKPSMPTVSFSELNFKGKLTDKLPIPGPIFYNPGSFDNQVPRDHPPIPYNYPVYNEVLGTFALLETPHVKLSKTIKGGSYFQGLDKWLDPDGHLIPFLQQVFFGRNFVYQHWTQEYQLQLASDLKYVFNGALDITKTNVRASFVVNLVPRAEQLVNAFNDPALMVNLSSSQKNVNNPYPIQTKTSEYLAGDNFQVGHVEVLHLDPPAAGQINKQSLETDFFPADAFKQVVAGYGANVEYYNREVKKWGETTGELDNHLIEFPVPPLAPINQQTYDGFGYTTEILLKLLVDIEYGTPNTPGYNKVTQVFTYPIPDDHVTLLDQDIVPDLANTNSNIQQYPENLKLYDVVFDGNPVDGCMLSGNHYTCRAWKDVSIKGNLSTQGNYTVDIIAGNEITETPESVVSGEIVREVIPLLDYSQPVPPVYQSDVQSFCDKNNPIKPYQANRSKNLVADNSSSNPDVTVTPQPLDFIMYPNPAQQSTLIRMNLVPDGAVPIRVVDITGKLIEVRTVEVTPGIYSIDVSACTKGIYLVTVSTTSETITKQLVIQ